MTDRKKRRMRNDIVLAFSLVAVSLALMLVLLLTRQSGKSVTVTLNGETYAVYALDSDRRVTIESENGQNTLVFSDGRVYMESADCKDRLCVRHAPIAYGGESIVCLPHGLIVRITSDDAPDITG